MHSNEVGFNWIEPCSYMYKDNICNIYALIYSICIIIAGSLVCAYTMLRSVHTLFICTITFYSPK